VDGIEAGKHGVFTSTSPSEWTNDSLGLAWIEQVSDTCTKEKARRRWRLLIINGHGSHLAINFDIYCDTNKILLAVFPPH
jgi:hypothetical protein